MRRVPQLLSVVVAAALIAGTVSVAWIAHSQGRQIHSLRLKLATASNAADTNSSTEVGLEQRVSTLEQDMNTSTDMTAAAATSLGRRISDLELELNGVPGDSVAYGGGSLRSQVEDLQQQLADLQQQVSVIDSTVQCLASVARGYSHLC